MKNFLNNLNSHSKTILTSVLLLFIATTAQAQFSAAKQFFGTKQPVLLAEEDAFAVTAEVSQGVLTVKWSIADDYYMYREQFMVQSTHAGVTLGEPSFAQGEIEDDPEFGKVEVYFYNTQFSLPISANFTEPQAVELILRGQGCNKPVGVCYPPQMRTLTVHVQPSDFQSANTAPNTAPNTTPSHSSGNVSSNTSTDTSTNTLWAYVLTALGAGILLSFTPCVLPMIPILAGVIAGQHNPSKLRSGWLAICYVLGTVVTYAIAGWLAGAAGTQLQAYFQNPWVIGFICAIMVLLAASLFGWFKIALPANLQTRLTNITTHSRTASVSSFLLGLISALVVGACVSPILILSLGTAISQGDPVLGASIMAAMATGMGLLLIIFGFGAGWILPKTGQWMEQIQVIFGFMVLGVGIFLLSTLPNVATLFLWSGLLLCASFYLWGLAEQIPSLLTTSLFKAVSFAGLLWGAMALLGGANNSNGDILDPLASINFNAPAPTANLNFQTVTSQAQAVALLEQAKQSGQPALVDFYATWCLDCKRMHRTTFKDPAVVAALKNWRLIEIDVTQTNTDSQTVKQFFKVFGPPATLFFNADGSENTALRQYGYIKSENFLNLLAQTSTTP